MLDLAAGGGRHARFFMGRKHPVTALDRSLDGMRDLESLEGVSLVKFDLEADPWPFDEPQFGAIVVTRYLHRPLLPRFAEALIAGGVLLYETFAQGNEVYGRPADPDHLLAPGELLEACRGRLTVVAFEHGTVYTPRPSVIQRIAAVSGRQISPL